MAGGACATGWCTTGGVLAVLEGAGTVAALVAVLAAAELPSAACETGAVGEACTGVACVLRDAAVSDCVGAAVSECACVVGELAAARLAVACGYKRSYSSTAALQQRTLLNY